MPFADSQIQRAYQQGYSLGSQEANTKAAPPLKKFSDPDMQRAYEGGWKAGRKAKDFALQRKLYRARWFQKNKQRLTTAQRQRRRRSRTDQAISALPALVSRIASASDTPSKGKTPERRRTAA